MKKDDDTAAQNRWLDIFHIEFGMFCLCGALSVLVCWIVETMKFVSLAAMTLAIYYVVGQRVANFLMFGLRNETGTDPIDHDSK